MRNIYIDLSSDSSSQPQIFGGYSGEHNETILQVKLPSRMIDIECSGYRFDFQTSEDNKISSPLISVDKLEDNILSFSLFEQLTVAGKLRFNVVAILADENNVSLIAKTNIVILHINPSADGNNVILDPDGYKDKLLEMIDERISQMKPSTWGNIEGDIEDQEDLAEALGNKEDISNKTTELTEDSTDDEYPSAAAAYNCALEKAQEETTILYGQITSGDCVPERSRNADYADSAGDTMLAYMAEQDEYGNNLAETREIAMGAQQALSASNYSTLVTLLNSANPEEYNKGQSFYIVTLEVPDIWLSSNNEETSVSYTYTTDQQLIQDVIDNGGALQVGYYKISFLETGKVDLSNYYTKSQVDTKLEGKIDKMAGIPEGQVGIEVDYISAGSTNMLQINNTVDMENYNIQFLGEPYLDGDATNKGYVDGEIAKIVNGEEGYKPAISDAAVLAYNDENGLSIADGYEKKKLTIKDTTSTSITLTASSNRSYIYGELTAFNLSFANGTDNAEIDIMFKSGVTPTTLTVSGTNKIHGSFAPSANAYVEINAKWYIDKWVVLFNEVK